MTTASGKLRTLRAATLRKRLTMTLSAYRLGTDAITLRNCFTSSPLASGHTLGRLSVSSSWPRLASPTSVWGISLQACFSTKIKRC